MEKAAAEVEEAHLLTICFLTEIFTLMDKINSPISFWSATGSQQQDIWSVFQ